MPLTEGNSAESGRLFERRALSNGPRGKDLPPPRDPARVFESRRKFYSPVTRGVIQTMGLTLSKIRDRAALLEENISGDSLSVLKEESSLSTSTPAFSLTAPVTVSALFVPLSLPHYMAYYTSPNIRG